jgi:hypothetical protein
MDIRYKCKCMKDEATLNVPDRRQNADLGDWMNMLSVCISTDHRALSPLCMRTEMEYAKIPMPENAPGVGMPPKMDA